MAFTAHNPLTFYDAIVAQIVSSTGKTVAKGQAPTHAASEPFAVVYPQDETDVESTLADPHDMTVFEWLVTSGGIAPEQVLGMQQKVRVALLGWLPVVAGLKLSHVMRDGGGPLIRNDAIQPPEFSVSDRFIVLAD